MSSTGTRKERNVQERAADALIEIDKELIQSFKIFSEASNAVAGLAGPPVQNSPKTPAGNYLAREGDSMIGPIALGPPLNFRVEVDANNTIDIGPLNDNRQYSSNIQLDDLQPNSSTLDIIANANFDGQILIMRTFAPTVPYTIRQADAINGGNIQTADEEDIILGDLQMIVLVFDESLIVFGNTGGTWRVLGGAGGTGGAVNDPVILNENDLGTIGVPGNIEVDWSLANYHRAILGASITIDMINLPVTGKWERIYLQFTQDGTGNHTVTFNDSFDNNITPVINSTADSISFIRFYSYNDGVDQFIIAENAISDFAAGVADPNYLLARLSADQTTNTADDDQIEFDTVVTGSGLGVTNGVVSGFLAGHLYECEAAACFEDDVGSGPVNVDIQFFDIAGASLIGTKGNGISYNSPLEFTPQINAAAIFIPSADSDTLELRIKDPNVAVNVISGTAANRPQTYLKITDITGFVGGGGTTVLFPNILIQDVNTIVNPGATVNLDLSAFQTFVIEIDADLEITFTNPPSGVNREEQFKLEIIQDAFGGHDVTYSQTISPVDPPVIDTGANKREVLTGFARRDSVGTILYNIYTVGSS